MKSQFKQSVVLRIFFLINSALLFCVFMFTLFASITSLGNYSIEKNRFIIDHPEYGAFVGVTYMIPFYVVHMILTKLQIHTSKNRDEQRFFRLYNRVLACTLPISFILLLTLSILYYGNLQQPVPIWKWYQYQY